MDLQSIPCSFLSKQAKAPGSPSSAAASTSPLQSVSMAHSSISPTPAPTDAPEVQTPNRVNSNGHLVLPKAAQLVQEAELNVDAFLSLPCNSWGETAQEAAGVADKDFSALSRCLGTPPGKGQQWEASTGGRCEVFPLGHMHTQAHHQDIATSTMEGRALPQERGWFSPAVPETIPAPPRSFSILGDSVLR